MPGDAGYAEPVTETTGPPEGQPDSGPADPEVATSAPPVAEPESAHPDDHAGKRRAALRETVILAVIALVLYYVMLTFVARPYLIPSESMEPTLHGCSGCVGDRIMVDKVTFRFGSPQPGDVIVFKGPPPWNIGYKSIRSHNALVRWVQNALSFIGFVPPDENDLVKRVIAVGCRACGESSAESLGHGHDLAAADGDPQIVGPAHPGGRAVSQRSRAGGRRRRGRARCVRRATGGRRVRTGAEPIGKPCGS